MNILKTLLSVATFWKISSDTYYYFFLFPVELQGFQGILGGKFYPLPPERENTELLRPNHHFCRFCTVVSNFCSTTLFRLDILINKAAIKKESLVKGFEAKQINWLSIVTSSF